MFTQIFDNIFIGNSHDALHLPIEQLQAAGVTAIINTAKDLTNTRVIHKQFTMAHVPLTDGGANKIAMCGIAVQTLQAMLEDGEKVMVHCHEGRSRSVATVATWMVKHLEEFTTIDQAEAFIKTKRPEIFLKPNLKALFQAALDQDLV